MEYDSYSFFFGHACYKYFIRVEPWSVSGFVVLCLHTSNLVTFEFFTVLLLIFLWNIMPFIIKTASQQELLVDIWFYCFLSFRYKLMVIWRVQFTTASTLGLDSQGGGDDEGEEDDWESLLPYIWNYRLSAPLGLLPKKGANWLTNQPTNQPCTVTCN